MENTEIQKTSGLKETQLSDKSIKIISYIINLILLAVVYFVLINPIISNWGNPVSHSAILSKILFIPLFGLAGLLFFHKSDNNGIKFFSLIYCIIPLLLILYMLFFFDGSIKTGYQFMEQHQWIRITDPPNPEPGEDFRLVMRMNYRVGVDGFSFPLLLLTGLLGVLACIASWKITHRIKEYFAWFLVLFISVMGVFLSLNYVLLYVFWEFALIPAYFLIGIWGGNRKEQTAMKFFLYNLLGSLFLVIGILWMFFAAGLRDFDMILIAERLENNVPLIIGRYMWLATFLAFAIRMPIFPFHTWLADTQSDSPTPVAILMSGLLLPMGAYGLARVSFTNFPEATKFFIPMMIVLAVINVVYGACVAMAQDNLKRIIAYSSITYMGLALLGLLSFNTLGWLGAFMILFGHGLVSTIFYMLAGILHDRTDSNNINEFGGLMKYMRKYSLYMFVGSMAIIGIPGLVLFWGWFWSLLGAFSPDHTHVSMMRTAVIISLIGVFLTAAYSLWTYQRIFMHAPNEKWKKLKDVNWREQISLLPLVLIIIAIGIFPSPIINLFNGKIQGLLEWFARF